MVKVVSTLILGMLLPVLVQAQSDKTIQAYFKEIRESFKEDNAFQTVAYIEQRWRLAGNQGFDESIHFVESILKKAGYINETVAAKDQRLTYRIEKRPMKRLTWEPIDALLEIVGDAEPLLKFSTNRNMIAINSSSTTTEGMILEVVYAENTSKQVLDKLDLSNKILFVEQSIGQVYRAANPRGAVGALGYAIPAYTQPTKHVNSIQFSAIQQVDSVNKGFGILLSTQAKNRLKLALEKGPVKLRVKIVTKQYQSEELTLIADIKGDQQEAERFVFSAHVQEPGANDNATGVGTLAEMARIAAVMVKKKQFKPGRSISFIWGDEIISTRRYVTENKALAKGILWGMSLDMVGEDTKKTGGTFLIEKMPDPSAVWTRGDEKHSEWGGQPLPESAIVPHYFNDFILSRSLDQAATNGWVVKTNPYEGGSDHTPFLDAKIPGLLMWHFTDVFYHTDADRLENVSAWEMKNVGVTALVSAMVLTTANEQTSGFLLKELQQSAFKRLELEYVLSTKVLLQGGDLGKESHILDTWGKYYEAAMGKMDHLIVGEKNEAFQIAIKEAQLAVTTKTQTLIQSLK